MQDQKAAVDAGQWLMYRYNPDRTHQGLNPMQLDSRSPKIPVEQFLHMENRFNMLKTLGADDAKNLLDHAQHNVDTRWQMYQYMAAQKPLET